jgi:hypothetical protein
LGKARFYNDRLSILSFRSLVGSRHSETASGTRSHSWKTRRIGAIFMAQRLATNYASAYFTMSEQELTQFVKLFANEKIDVKEKVYDNGDRDITIDDHSGEIQLTFHRKGNRYSCESSYVIKDLTLANAMRKAMKAFKGHGIVHRIYESFTVVYHYDEGSVIRIEEVTEDSEVPIYEGTHIGQTSKELERLYMSTGSEEEIKMIREETDRLLDLRNWAKKVTPERISAIDQQLSGLSTRLFLLEA